MTGRRGPSLQQRSGEPGAALAEARHCYVVDGPLRWPGLLLEWRRREAWEGLVVYATTDPGGRGVRLVQRWLPAADLEPLA